MITYTIRNARQILFSTFFPIVFPAGNSIERDMMDNESLPGLPVSIDVSPDDVERVQGLPLRAQQIGALLAAGFTCPDVDVAFTLPDGTARAYRAKYFTDKNISLSPRTRDAIIAAYLRSKSLQLVNGITPAKVADAGVGELAKSATMLMSRAQDLEDKSTGPDRAQVLSNALSLLAQQSQAQKVMAKSIGANERNE